MVQFSGDPKNHMYLNDSSFHRPCGAAMRLTRLGFENCRLNDSGGAPRSPRYAVAVPQLRLCRSSITPLPLLVARSQPLGDCPSPANNEHGVLATKHHISLFSLE
jgi:hypothetical protein